ncbi:MAG: translation initiation factor IF-6 [Candidatus Thorarchaeota archaeon]|nr:translation initiation factor IF-6 [Candidatus Thorarchaeota archaeon]
MARTDFEGDSNVGAFAIATDRFVFVSPNMSEKSLGIIRDTFLDLPLIQSTVATLDAVGIMACANSHGIILPYTVSDEELATLKREAENIIVDWIDSKMTALGNIVLANDNGAICHPDFDKAAQRKIADVLDVEVVPGTVARLPIVGSNTIATANGAVAHPLTTTEELELVTELLKVDVEMGTVNRGSPYIHLGIVANSEGMIAGSETTGVELANISQALGFV